MVLVAAATVGSAVEAVFQVVLEGSSEAVATEVETAPMVVARVGVA